MKYFFFFLATILLAGCSWLSSVYVYNRSKNTVVVRFKGAYSWEADVKKISGWSGKGAKFDSAMKVYTRLESDSVLYVELPPGAALLIGGHQHRPAR